MYWEVGRATPAARRQSARQVLRLWRESDSYHGADDYLDRLGRAESGAEEAGRPIDVSDLPTP